MKLPKFITQNLVLKITSLNGVVVSIRLVISACMQWLLARLVGDAGYALVGDIRNLIPMLTSTSTLGVFNGAVKYVSEYKENKPELSKVFSTVTVFYVFGSLVSALVLFIWSEHWAIKIFGHSDYESIIKFLALMVPFIGLSRLLNSVINGLTAYKSYAKVELTAYVLSAFALLIGLFMYNIKGALIGIALAPMIYVVVVTLIFGKTLKNYIQPKKLSFSLSYKQQLLGFTLMSFVSTFLLNYIEIDLRGQIADKVSEGDAGSWTAVTFISKNYMVFASGLFTLYVLPNFAKIKTQSDFVSEVIHIYKTILPIFGFGMLLVYVLRHLIIDIIFPDFNGMAPLFKWQLLGDFVRLAALVLAHQFLAKKLVKSFIVTEFISIALFYGLSMILIPTYKTEGIVMAHFIRYILYIIIVAVVVKYYFKTTTEATD